MNDSVNNDNSILLEADPKPKPKPKPATLAELLSLWNIQENLFQGYRRLLLVSEGVFITICSMILSHGEGRDGKSGSQLAEIVLLIGLIYSGITIYFKFERIIKLRGELVHFCQTLITKAERNEDILLPFKEISTFHKNLESKWQSDPDYVNASKEPTQTRAGLSGGIRHVIIAAWLTIIVAVGIKYFDYLWHYEIQNYFFPVMLVFSPFIFVGLMIFSDKSES